MLFISPLKLFSFSRYLNFCLEFLVMYQRGLIRKITLISNFMTSQPGLQTIIKHILANISITKCSQTMKFGQLREYLMKNIFLEKSYKECGEITSPTPLSINKIEHISWPKVLYSLFLLYAKLRAIEIFRN